MADYTFQVGDQAHTVDVSCLWCGESLEDGRIETGWTYPGPDWGAASSSEKGRKPGTMLDYGCYRSPANDANGSGGHTPNVLVTWDAHLVKIPPLAGYVLADAIPLTVDDWLTTEPAPAGLLPNFTDHAAEYRQGFADGKAGTIAAEFADPRGSGGRARAYRKGREDGERAAHNLRMMAVENRA